MIYTVTFNPALDYIVGVKNFNIGMVNRTATEQILPGGKGINVSIVLTHLGVDNTTLGFVAGFTGDEIVRRLKSEGCNTDFISVEGNSRINFKLKSNEETEINGAGPKIETEAVNELLLKLDKLQENDYLVLAGSIPESLPNDMYKRIMERLQEKKINIIVDATLELLVNVLQYKPFLIKPNKHELGEIFGVKIKTNEEVIKYAKKMIDMGASNCLVSMAGDGAIMVTKDGRVLEHGAPKGEVVNSVGAGDSMVAGFIAGYLKNNNFEEAFKMGIAAGSASTFSEYLAKKEEVEKIYSEL